MRNSLKSEVQRLYSLGTPVWKIASMLKISEAKVVSLLGLV